MTMTYEYAENLYINMTNNCSNHCEFCLRENSNGSLYATNLWYDGNEPTKEQILADIKTHNLDEYHNIVFCGYGEPACRWDDMLWLCDEMRKLGTYKIRLNTNGQANLICKRDVTAETDSRFDIISVSLNADTAEKYEALCHSEFGIEAYSEMLNFTRKCVKHVHKVYMTVVDTMSDTEIDNCRDICEGLGAKFKVRAYIES